MHWLSSPTVRWDRGFFRKLLVVCLPIVIQNLMSASLHIIDGVMIGQLGDAPYAAVTQATRYVFVYQLFLFGLASGCGIFFSQHWGTQDVKSMRRAMGLCFRGALVLAVLFGGLGLLFPQGVMSIFLPKGESFGYAIQYLTIVAAGFLITAVDTVYATCMKSAGKTVIPMTAGICSILTNTFLNWILIYGNLGAPALGVRGAAIATVIAAGVSLAINVGCSYGMKLPSAFRWQDWKLPDRAYLTQFAKTVLPVVLNEGFWSMGTSMYSVFYGRLGDAAVAAVGIVNTVDQLIFTMIYGIMNATAILVGNHLGAGDKEGARLTARRLIFACVVVGAVMGCIQLGVKGQLVSVFNVSQEAKQLANIILFIGAFTIWVRAINSINVVGILRAGGDTVFSMLLDTVALWVVGVPLVGIAALVLHWPVYMCYLCTVMEEVIKMLVGLPRFRSGKWMNDLNQHAEAEA